ncbi:UNVERIFIED_CONTAM: hypothetical protein K2H54_030451 [Gekko kuhli]
MRQGQEETAGHCPLNPSPAPTLLRRGCKEARRRHKGSRYSALPSPLLGSRPSQALQDGHPLAQLAFIQCWMAINNSPVERSGGVVSSEQNQPTVCEGLGLLGSQRQLIQIQEAHQLPVWALMPSMAVLDPLPVLAEEELIKIIGPSTNTSPDGPPWTLLQPQPLACCLCMPVHHCCAA